MTRGQGRTGLEGEFIVQLGPSVIELIHITDRRARSREAVQAIETGFIRKTAMMTVFGLVLERLIRGTEQKGPGASICARRI